MATLEKIRSKAVLLVVIVGLALFAFIIGDALRSSTTFMNQRKENIAVVEGQTIKIQDYQMRVEERTNMIKARNAGSSINEDQTNQIRQSVFNEWINKILLDKECDKLGLAVSKDELQDIIMGNNISPMIQQMPEFQDPQTRQFDRNRLINFLQSIESDDYTNYAPEIAARVLEAKQNWLTIEQQVQEQQLQSKLMALLSATMTTNNLDAKAAYDDSKVSVDFDYVSQFYSSIPDDAVSVTDDEISKLYNERKSTFKQAEAVLLDYITVNIVPSKEDYNRILLKMEEIKTRLEESSNPGNVASEVSETPYLDAYVSYSQLSNEQKTFIDHATIGTTEGPMLNSFIYSIYKLESETVAPDSVKLNLLNLPQITDEKAIKHISDSLIAVIKGGTSFADMVSTATNGNSDGDIGWQTETTLVKQVDAAFKNEVFAAKINEPLLISSAFGSFLVQVVEKTAPVKKYKIATIQLTVNPSQETKTKLYNDLNQYISSNHNLEAFKSAAAEAGYNVQSNVEVAKGQLNLSGIENTRQVIQWALKNKKGAISDIYECQNQEYFVVAAVEGILKEGVRPLSAVSEVLKRELLNDKKAEKIISDLKAKNFTDFAQYAEAMNTSPQSVKFVTFATPRISLIGNEPVLNANAPVAQVGKVSGPYKGKNAVYVIQITDKKESEQAYDESVQKQTLQMQNGYRIYRMFQSDKTILRDNAKIEDNFNRFF
ncbi:MAG: SurA N-terminal domain-containing protein [Dysgonamonadaceae bacterium]|jgi:peptidyl-prolyl cis-trans isomerase D|nr:SurA N-terminal domain-containing protein [Dysgonamonadaceae bacterium]